MSQPEATKIKRPSGYRGHTRYAIDGYEQHFRYVQGGIMNGSSMHNWTTKDAPTRINGVLCVVARIKGGYGFFAELPPQ